MNIGLGLSFGLGLGLGFIVGLVKSQSSNSSTWSHYLDQVDARKYRALREQYWLLAQQKQKIRNPPPVGQAPIMQLVAAIPYDMCLYTENPESCKDKPIGFCWQCGDSHPGGKLFPVFE